MLSCYLLTTFNNIDVHNYNFYGISNVIYCIFYLFRYFVIGLIIILISTILHINSNRKKVIIFEIIFLFFLCCFNEYIGLQDKVTFNVWKYFTLVDYSNFSLELLSSVTMILVLEIIFLLIYYFTNKFKKVVIS